MTPTTSILTTMPPRNACMNDIRSLTVGLAESVKLIDEKQGGGDAPECGPPEDFRRGENHQQRRQKEPSYDCRQTGNLQKTVEHE